MAVSPHRRDRRSRLLDAAGGLSSTPIMAEMQKRLFIAVDFPVAVQRRLARLVAVPPPGVRPTPPGQMHLTLHFLGDVAEERITALRTALGAVKAAPFMIDLGGTGRFPPRGRPTVLWVGVAPNPALFGLHDRIATVLAAAGFVSDHRAFVPHVTLARLGPRSGAAWIATCLAGGRSVTISSIPIREFVLYSSTLGPAGAVHVPDAVYRLADDQ